MNQNAELLNFIYQNSEMGVKTLDQIIGIVEDVEMIRQLEDQKNEYQDIHENAKAMLTDNGYDEKKISAMEKISAYLMINMKTLTDKSTGHIAEMLIKGGNMGIIDAKKRINEYEQSAEKDILALMKKLLQFEEDNAEKMKQFL